MKVLSLISLFFLYSCMSGDHVLQKIITIEGKTMGTTYSVKAVVHQDYSQFELEKQIQRRLEEVNRAMSTYIGDSEISIINNAKKGTYEIGTDFKNVLAHALRLAKQTQGAFDPTIGPLVNLWGFGPKGQRIKPSADKIQDTMKLIGHQNIELEDNKLTKKIDGVYLDLSASAKGYGVDAVLELLGNQGLNNAMVEIGGEVRTLGESITRPWKIGVESPIEGSFERKIVKVISLKNVALATSGSYRNFFREKGKSYSHTIDYKSGSPVETSLASVSVISDTCMDADAKATAIMAMGTEKGYNYANKNDIKAYLIYKDPSAPGKFKTLETEGFKKVTAIQ